MKKPEHPWNVSNAEKVLCSQKKVSLDLFNVLQNGSFRNCSLKGSFENQKWFFYGITAKTPFWNIYFKCSLLTLTLFQNYMNFFLLLNIEDI